MLDVNQTVCKAIIFDMDGVILDTEAVCRRAYHITGKRFGLSDDDVEKGFKATMGCNQADSMSKLLELFGCNFAASQYIKASDEEFNNIEKSEGLPLMKGASIALPYLVNKGYHVALASSTCKEAVHRQLSHAGVIHYFETITTGDMVSHSKPHPEIYTRACKSIGQMPKSCIAVEDSSNGVISAVNAGMKCIMIPDQIQPSDNIKKLLWHICCSLEDLISLF